MAKEIWSSERERPIELISRLSDNYTLIRDVNGNILEPDKEQQSWGDIC